MNAKQAIKKVRKCLARRGLTVAVDKFYACSMRHAHQKLFSACGSFANAKFARKIRHMRVARAVPTFA